MKVKDKIKRKNYYLVSILLVFFLLITMYLNYSQKYNPKLIIVAKESLKKEIYNDINNSIIHAAKNNKEDILKVYLNQNDEIVYVDYDLEKVYKILEYLTKNLQNKARSKEKFVIKLPFMVFQENVLLHNLGPKVTVRVNQINSLLTKVYTKITDYGLNNALLEAYIKIKIEGRLITPVSSQTSVFEYDFLVSSKVINGKVPSIYGHALTSGVTFDIPIE